MIIQCGELFLLLSYNQNRFIPGERFWVFRFILGETVLGCKDLSWT